MTFIERKCSLKSFIHFNLVALLSVKGSTSSCGLLCCVSDGVEMKHKNVTSVAMVTNLHSVCFLAKKLTLKLTLKSNKGSVIM